MPSTYYVPLHVHTDASSDGAGTVESLVKEAVSKGFHSLAMTDHGTLANAVAFWSACTENEIKPILGLEAYLSYRGERHHITLHAQNEDGFNNLVSLNSWSHVENYTAGYPLITLDSLYQYRGGISALTGCASSAIHSWGAGYIADLVSTLGRPNVGVEVMFVGTHDIWTKPLDLSKIVNLPFVITNDTHYPCRDQFHAHQAITKARKGFTYNSSQLWLKTGDEVFRSSADYLDKDNIIRGLNSSIAYDRTIESWDMKRKPTLPHIPDCIDILRGTLKRNLRRDIEGRSESDRQTRMKRLQYEFHILNEKGFLDYIYILSDIVDWAHLNNIYTGPGRGSGGGSYLLYLLGITRIDPIEWGLLFERFINPARGDYPDVDIDFEADRRSEVMEYAKNKWGAIPIATFSCYSHKSAIHDIARTLTIPKSLEVAAADSPVDSEDFEKFINANPHALTTYKTMLGQIRHRSKHAAGVIIANRPVPIERSGKDGELVAAWAEGMNTKDLSKVGIVKFDLLSLSALSQLKWLEQETGDVCPHYDDELVYDLFCNGDVAGIFQWTGSDGIRDLTQRIGPRNFNDLATINALYRPGALDAGTAEHYPEYMKEPRLLHPAIDPILENTYGVICFQEQVMQVIATVMGGDLYSADTARRLLTKADVGNPKWEAEVTELRNRFFFEGECRYWKRELLDLLWFEIYTHSRYSFNASHAFAYTMISYELAYFKVYYRPAFITAMLRYDKGNSQTYILDAIESGLDISLPDINQSNSDYELHGDTIYIPLGDVAHVGEVAVNEILRERLDNGPFFSYADFAKRIAKKKCNNRARQQLERVGAFSIFADDPKNAIDRYEEIPVESEYQMQLETLGYIIPTASLVAKMNELRSKPVGKDEERFAGFVTKLDDRESEKGPYRVYHLSPFGSFWTRNPSDRIQVGTFVAGTKNFYGHSKDLKTYKLGARE